MPIDGDPAQGPQTRVTFDRFEPDRVSGVEFSRHDEIHRVGAGSEVVLSLGAIHTSKVLMQSGIGDPPNYTDTASPCCSTFPGLVKTCKTILVSTVSGSTNSRSRRATLGARRPSSRRATLVWTAGFADLPG
jgi:choline dehydrogenase-like flavoprotein